MDVQAELAELRESIMRAGLQCERMLRAANYPANADVRQNFLDRAVFWSDFAIRRSVEIRNLLSSPFVLSASDEAALAAAEFQLELSFSGEFDIREAASV